MKKIPTLSLVAALLGASLHSLALAQSSAPPPAAASAASAASAQAPAGPRVLTPTEQRNNADNASAPDLRPDRPVVPQISVPFGRAPPAPGSAPSTPRRRGEAAPLPAPIGDAAARCESLTSDLERAACRKRLAHAKASH